MRCATQRSGLSVGLVGLVMLVACRSSDDVEPTSRSQSGVTPTVPAGFTDVPVATVVNPIALAFTPDGRLLVSTQAGQVRVVKNDALSTQVTLDLSAKLCTNSERGLLGLAVDPAFKSNGYIYAYYTFNKSGNCSTNAADSPVNRVSRFTLGTGDRVDPASELVLVDNIYSPNGNHNSGDLNFGKDGYLYISVGDGGCSSVNSSLCGGTNNTSRGLHVLNGKILRIATDGTVPPTNPFMGTSSVRCNMTGHTDPGKICQETFASGFRNPFRFASDPNSTTTRFFVNDVGQDTWEEVDLLQAGADYGWNVREGHCAMGSMTDCGAPPAGMTNPIFDYDHKSLGGQASITGGAFVPSGLWPGYEGAYLYGEYVAGKIVRLLPNGSGGYASADFATSMGNSSVVGLAFGSTGGSQALYYTTFSGGGQVRRLSYAGAANRAPTAVATATPTAGALPLLVQFDGSGSSDPDTGDTLTFDWDFGDGSPHASGAKVNHSYTGAGKVTAKLVVTDSRGLASAASTLVLQPGNAAPVAMIVAPTTSTTYSVGQQVTLVGSATDSEDGNLAASALSWTVILHHNDHTHPFVPPTSGNNIVIKTPAPEDLAATAHSYLEILLTATDSGGLSTTISQKFNPTLISVTLATTPVGLNLQVNGTTVVGPAVLTTWPGYVLSVNAPAQNDASGKALAFGAWSDGGAQSHDIVSPGSPATYTATFAPAVLPNPWLSQDVGAEGVQGSAGAQNGVFTVSGSGTNIFDAADSFYFVSQPLAGDGELTARVTAIQNTDGWAKAGVMIRDSVNSSAAEVSLVVTPSNGIVLYSRSALGSNTDKVGGAFLSAPVWLKLKRVGNLFVASSSADGSTWASAGSVTVAMGATAVAGLAVTSHNNSVLCRATFDNVSLTNAVVPPPLPLPSPWGQSDVGAVGVTGGASAASDGTFTVTASGSNIFDSADGFHFVYQTLNGDGQLVARVANLQRTDDFAKAGVMIRASTDAASAHASMVVTAAAGTFFYARTSGGAATDKTAGPTFALPVWVRITRVGSLLSGDVSADGTSWTAVGSATFPLPGAVLIGLAVTSHSNGTLARAQFDQVTQR